MNVLIVDDDVPWSNIAAAMLRPVTGNVRMAETFKDAKRQIDKPNGFDVVLLDLTLPDSLAWETIEHIPEINKTGRKVVIVTGQPVDDTLRDIGKKHGALDVLYKGSVRLAEDLQAVCS
jgi:DNA-binding NtrC family response regulator